MRLPGIAALLVPYEVAGALRSDMDDPRVIRLVAEWLDTQPDAVSTQLAAFMAATVAAEVLEHA